MKKLLLAIASALMILFAIESNGQSTTIENVLDIKSKRQTGAIIEEGNIIGYYVFYFKEKEDRKNSTYEIEIFDNNYNSLRTTEITRPKKTILREVTFNGEAFVMEFFDSKTGFEFITFDKNGDETGSLTLGKDDVPKAEWRSAQYGGGLGNGEYTFSNGSSGFFRVFYNDNKKTGYRVVAWDNELNELWRTEAPESGLFEDIDINAVTEDVIAATIWKRKSRSTAKMDFSVVLMDPNTGEIIKEIETGNEREGKRSVLKIHIDEPLQKIYAIGEYYLPKDDMFKDKSQGLYLMEMDYNGEMTSLNQYSWARDIDRLAFRTLRGEERKEYEKGYQLMIQDVIRTKSGELFILAEQYRKQINAAGATLNVIGRATGTGSASSFDVTINNFVLLQLNSDYELADLQMIEKKKTHTLLPEGMGLWYGSTRLGYYVKMMGGFDYAFSTYDLENDEYTIVYTDNDRREEKGDKKSDFMLGVIHIENDNAETTRVPLDFEGKRYWLNQAKPGHISIMEYFKKEKMLEFRVERIIY